MFIKKLAKFVPCALLLLCLVLFAPPSAQSDCPGYGGLFGCQTVGPDYQSMTAIGLQLSGDMVTMGPGGGYTINSNDCPEGCYSVDNANTTNTVTTTLPAALQSGTLYNVFFYAIGYDTCSTLSIAVGGSSSTPVTAEDRSPSGPSCGSGHGENGYWTIASPITPGSTSAAATITITKVGGPGGSSNHVALRAIFITSNTNLTMLSDSEAVNLVFPATEDNTIDTTDSLVADGSFETGYDAVKWATATNRSQNPSTVWSTAQAHTGTHSLAFDISDITGVTNIYSETFLLKPNRRYTFSGQMRLSTGSVFCYIIVANAFDPPSGFTARHYWGGALSVTSSGWTDFTFTGYAKAYPTPEYRFEVQCGGVASATAYLDTVVLREGTDGTYVEANPLEVFASTTHAGNVYYTTDTLTATLTMRNSTGSPISKPVVYEIRDWTEKVVSSGTQDLSVAANTTSTTTIPVSTGGKTGYFTLTYWFPNEDGTKRIFTYSIVPQYNADAADTTSAMGVHCPAESWNLAALQRLGFKFCRLLSPVSIDQWNFSEATEGNFTYYDSVVSLISSYGLTPLAVHFSNASSGPPAYAVSGGLPILSKVTAHVGTIVDHYKSTVKYWEVENEPDHRWTAAFYATYLKTVVDAIEANDLDDATIVCMGGSTAAYITSVKAELDSLYGSTWYADHCTASAGHSYFGGQPPEQFTSTIDSYGRPVWNTEAGLNDHGSFTGKNSQFAAPGVPLYEYSASSRFYEGRFGNAVDGIAEFVRTLSSKMSKFFYYTAQHVGIEIRNASTSSSGSWSMLEHDHSIGSKGIAMAIGGSFLDHSTRQGDVCGASNTYCLLFEQASTTPVAVIWSADNLPRSITLSGSNGDYLAYDIMGNSVTLTGTTIPYGRVPLYVKGNGISTATFSSRLSAASPTTRTDTVAPNIVIVDGPLEPVATGGRTRVRWIAFDDVSKPNLGEQNVEQLAPPETANPDAITYSWYLAGVDSGFGAYKQTTYVDITSMSASAGVFYVRAKDVAGNVSSTASICVGPSCDGTSQYVFRFRNDNGSETTATWAAAENTNFAVAPDTGVRIRFGIDTVGAIGAQDFLLEAKKSTDSVYQAVPAAAPTQQVVNLTSSQSWVVPAWVTSIQVECIGPGGAGANSSTASSGGGGGKGGTYVKKNTYTTIPGSSLTATVTAGSSQIATTLLDGATTVVSCAAGNNATSTTGATGTTGTNTGDTITAGTNGSNGSGATSGAGGAGGAPLGGAGGTSVGAGNNGVAGTAPGGGGSGGSANISSNTATLTNASPNFTTPAGVTNINLAECRGPGGNGGSDTNNGANGAGGGGGGGYASKSNVPVTASTAYNATVPAGGSESSTSWTGNSGLGCVAAGATNAGNDGNGTAGAAGTTGDVLRTGGSGANRNATTGDSGGGGEGAGSTANGGNASGITGGTGTDGGNGANAPTGNTNGAAGTVPGGGGSAGHRTSGGTKTGGAGAAGNVVLTYDTGSAQTGGAGASGRLVITYTAVAPVILSTSANIPAGGATATTAQLTPPLGKSTSNFTAGAISDDTNPAAPITIASGNYTEVEFDAKLVGSVTSPGDIYNLRITKNGTELDTYSNTPTLSYATDAITVETAANGSGSVVSSQNVQCGTGSVVSYSILRNSSMVFQSNPATTWSLTNKTGSVVDGDLVPAGDFKSATFTAHALGTGIVHATDGTLAGDSGTLTVNDTVAPVPGTGLSTGTITSSAIMLNWGKATDACTSQSLVQYEIRRSSSNNIDNLANAEANGIVQGSYTADIDTFNVTGPAITCNTTFYFAVLAKDASGNKGYYSSISASTLACPVGGPGRGRLGIR